MGGYLQGMVLAAFAGPVIIDIQGKIAWNLSIALLAIGLSLLVGMSASLYPAVKATRLDPVQALRFIYQKADTGSSLRI